MGRCGGDDHDPREHDTQDALRALKGSRSYDELVVMFLQLVPEGDDDGRFTDGFRLSLLEGLHDEGPLISHEEIKREFGLR